MEHMLKVKKSKPCDILQVYLIKVDFSGLKRCCFRTYVSCKVLHVDVNLGAISQLRKYTYSN